MRSTLLYRRRSPIRKLAVAVTCVVGTVACGVPPVAHADTPAFIDFGQSEMTSNTVQPTFVTEASHAMFLTVYGDGHQAMQVLPVRGDAVNTFAGEHPAWRLDSKMTWLVQMPVYVRELSLQTTHPGQASV